MKKLISLFAMMIIFTLNCEAQSSNTVYNGIQNSINQGTYFPNLSLDNNNSTPTNNNQRNFIIQNHNHNDNSRNYNNNDRWQRDPNGILIAPRNNNTFYIQDNNNRQLIIDIYRNQNTIHINR